MAQSDYRVTLTGPSASGVPPDQARAALARLFKLPDDRVQALLAELPVVIKKGLDEATARKYQAVLQQAGWRAEISAPGSSSTYAPPGGGAAGTALEATLAPPGALMADPRDVPPLEVDLSGLTLAEPGAQIGESREAAPLRVDLSGLTLAEPGARLDKDPS
ncbi:hypothetical protein [Thioalkalivibrio thiocyanodenitrificans]|uniref:hypothetical protein n=1 Tax=Thioalkalivibrio thiocyanodenitrificans TaxID=243063 RepID=UPI00036592E1|nr:hypothetical protein [Thioalkalivibrio thiocyanodenitrificans]